jgi:hypothetical protein
VPDHWVSGSGPAHAPELAPLRIEAAPMVANVAYSVIEINAPSATVWNHLVRAELWPQ